MLEDLTIESFEPYVGTSFWADFPNGSKVELRLTRAAKVMESEAARLPRHPFSLFFIGPKSFLLKQHTYRLRMKHSNRWKSSSCPSARKRAAICTKLSSPDDSIHFGVQRMR